MNFKFALHNFAGEPMDWYEVAVNEVLGETLESAPKPALSHHIFIVDRSGSMYSVLDDLKHTLIKILTLEEYRDTQLQVSLLSYSSEGDLKSHFERVSIQDVMESESKHLKSLKSLRPSGITGISQALKAAIGLIDDDEFSAISLHSDGFANDPSYRTERQRLEELAISVQERPVMINTIAHSSYSDFDLLAQVANLGSGSCCLALDIKEVYDALHDTSKFLLNNSGYPIEVDTAGSDFWALVSPSGRRFMTDNKTRKVRGLNPDDRYHLYRFNRLTQAQFKSADAPEFTAKDEGFHATLIALSRVHILQGKLNSAKYCLLTAQDATLLSAHANALTNDEVGGMAMALEHALFDERLGSHAKLKEAKISTNRNSVLKVLSLLRKHRKHVKINKPALESNYQRRTLGKLLGTRDDDGTLVPPEFSTEPRDHDEWRSISSLEINQNTANINLTLTEPVYLLNTDGERIEDVSGIALDGLTDFKSYTVVGDGRLNVSELLISISSKRLFSALEKCGVVSGDYKPQGEYTLTLTEIPTVDIRQKFKDLSGIFEVVARGRALKSVLSAMLKGRSEVYTDEQLAELSRHHLSAQLNLNFPMTSKYEDLDEAINKGEVDQRVSYKINLGNAQFTALSKIPSANAFLNNQYTLTLGGTDIDKAQWGKAHGCVATEKTTTKNTPTKRFLRPLFDDLLMVRSADYPSEGVVRDTLQQFDVSDELCDQVNEVIQNHFADEDQTSEVLTEVLDLLTIGLNDFFEERISPVIFYIGCTGLLPDRFQSEACSADSIKERYPDLSIGKAEAEGTFFDLGDDTLISVYTEMVMFSR
jgi:hypothetical protein